MDFTFYPHIQARAGELGGIKQTMFNKKLMAKAENSWMQLSTEEMARIEYEIAYAPKVLTTFVTSAAILLMNKGTHVLYPIPVRNIIWIYTSIIKNSMNLIPTYKEHTVNIVTRNGETHQIGPFTTAAISRKDIGGAAIEQIRNVIYPYRKGIIYGYSDEIQNYVCSNIQEAARMVDAKSMEPGPWQQQ